MSSTTFKQRAASAVAAIVGATGAAMFAVPAEAQENRDLSPAEIVEALKGGGHVIFIRHATTETDYADQVDAVMGDCSTQRPLSEGGWNEAKNIGAAFELYDIPVGDVIASQYCRGWQTADLAFGRYEKTADLNFEPAEDYTEEQMQAMRDNVVPHLSAIPEHGNTVLVGHDDPFDAATGIYPEPMGVVFAIVPGGDGTFQILGSIAPDDWAQLAR